MSSVCLSADIILSGFALGQQLLYFVCIYVLGHGVEYKNMIIVTDIKCQDQMKSYLTLLRISKAQNHQLMTTYILRLS